MDVAEGSAGQCNRISDFSGTQYLPEVDSAAHRG